MRSKFLKRHDESAAVEDRIRQKFLPGGNPTTSEHIYKHLTESKNTSSPYVALLEVIREQLELASAVAATKGDYSEHLNMNSVDKLIRVDEEFFSKSVGNLRETIRVHQFQEMLGAYKRRPSCLAVLR